MPVNRCRGCKGAGSFVNVNPKTKEIKKEICIHCKGKGYIFIRKENIQGGETNGILEKTTDTTNITTNTTES